MKVGVTRSRCPADGNAVGATRDIQEHVQLLGKVSEVVHPTIGPAVVLKDPNDDPVIYTAASGKAEAICTPDTDFLEPGVVTFCRNQGISILNDVELLQRLTSMG